MTPKTPPGQTRERIYRFVRDRLLAGNPPTVREVQEAFNFKAVESARAHLTALVKEGKLLKEGSTARGYRLPDTAALSEPPVQVPLLGSVPAGPLSEAIEDVEAYLPVRSKFRGAELFALRVEGDSMRDAGILNGDVVIVQRQPSADPGDIVVAMIDGEATVKTLFIEGRRVELRPQNPEYAPIVPDPDEMTVLGKVLEVRRHLDENPFRAAFNRRYSSSSSSHGQGMSA
jgi:repressor LexA